MGYFHLVICMQGSSISFHGSLAHFFLFIVEPYPIVHRCHSLLIHSSAEGYVGCFLVWALINKAAKAIVCKLLHGHNFLSLLHKHKRVHCMVRICLLLLDSTNLSFHVTMPFCNPTSSERESASSSASSLAFGLFSVFDVSYFSRCALTYFCFNLQFPNDILC